MLAPLLLAYASNQWSRYSLNYLADFSAAADGARAINVALGFDSSGYGTLASLAFTVPFAAASPYAGVVADRYDRRTVTASACAAWSLGTLGTAFSTNYEQALLCRLVIGLACAFSAPCAYTLLRDELPPSRAATASSVYSSGVYVGGALASSTVLLDNAWGWRSSETAVAVFGFVVAATVLGLLPDDDKHNDENAVASSASDDLKITDEGGKDESPLSLLTYSPRVSWLYAAAIARFCAGLSIGVWAAPYFRAAYPDDATSYAAVNAVVVGLCGSLSGVLGGAASDAVAAASFFRKDGNAGRLVVPAVGSLLAAPAWWFCVGGGGGGVDGGGPIDFSAAMVWLAVEYLVAECWFGPVVAVLQSEVPETKGGAAQGLFALAGAAGNVAPTLLGTLYGAATGDGGSDDPALRNLLVDFVCGGYVLSAVLFSLSALSPPSSSSGAKTEESATTG